MPTTIKPRDIPAGKVLLGEYGDPEVKANMAQVSVIRSACSLRVRAVVRLERSTPGFECAGSCARWTNGYLAVRWFDGSATHGQQYRDDAEGESKAREHFARLEKDG